MELPIAALCFPSASLKEHFTKKIVHYSYTLLIFKEQNTGTLWTGPREQK